MYDISNGTKPCATCKQEKPLSDFRKDSRSRTGVRSYCRECAANRDKNYRATDEGKQRIQQRKQTAEYKSKHRARAKIIRESPEGKTKRLEYQAKRRAERRLTPRKGVYLIHMNGIYKIGKSNYVSQRIASLRWTMPYPINLVHVISSDNPLAGEQQLHKRFAHCRMNSEWFALTIDDVAWISSLESI